MPNYMNSIHHNVRMLPTSWCAAVVVVLFFSVQKYSWNSGWFSARAPHRECAFHLSFRWNNTFYSFLWCFRKKNKNLSPNVLRTGLASECVSSAVVRRRDLLWFLLAACALALHTLFVLFASFMFIRLECARQSLVSRLTDFCVLLQLGFPSFSTHILYKLHTVVACMFMFARAGTSTLTIN